MFTCDRRLPHVLVSVALSGTYEGAEQSRRLTAELVAQCNGIVAALRGEVGTSRMTPRLDSPARALALQDLTADALVPGVPSLRGQTSIHQR